MAMFIVMLVSDYREPDEGGAMLIQTVYGSLNDARDVARSAVLDDPTFDHAKVYEVTKLGANCVFVTD